MILYACGVDWQHEFGEASDIEGCYNLYSSIENLKKDKKCYNECGIVELNLSIVKWIEPQNFKED